MCTYRMYNIHVQCTCTCRYINECVYNVTLSVSEIIFDVHMCILFQCTCMSAGMVDGHEVSDTERQFLASWKATRKARKKAQQKMTDPQG